MKGGTQGRLDDRDRAKARAGEAYCELLTEHDREPWHYIMLIQNKPIGREVTVRPGPHLI
ncbi:MAG: hypothetical protein ABSF69_26945 [Polyangiaceae bacterium]